MNHICVQEFSCIALFISWNGCTKSFCWCRILLINIAVDQLVITMAGFLCILNTFTYMYSAFKKFLCFFKAIYVLFLFFFVSYWIFYKNHQHTSLDNPLNSDWQFGALMKLVNQYTIDFPAHSINFVSLFARIIDYPEC